MEIPSWNMRRLRGKIIYCGKGKRAIAKKTKGRKGTETASGPFLCSIPSKEYTKDVTRRLSHPFHSQLSQIQILFKWSTVLSFGTGVSVRLIVPGDYCNLPMMNWLKHCWQGKVFVIESHWKFLPSVRVEPNYDHFSALRGLCRSRSLYRKRGLSPDWKTTEVH